MAIHKPKAPLEHMTKLLSNPVPKHTFMVGPQSLVVEEVARDAVDEEENDFIVINGNTPEEREKDIRQKLHSISHADKSTVIVNAPKTRSECYKLKEMGIVPEKVLVFEDSSESLSQFLKESNYTQEQVYLLMEDELQ